MAVIDVTRNGVELALEEFRRIGLDALLEKYGGRPSTRWYVEAGGRRFDQKVLLRAAYVHEGLGELPPRGPGRFNARDARRHLEANLGYTVVGATTPFPRVKALHFVVEHNRSIDYSRAEPLTRQEPTFHVSVEDEKVRFTMRDHHASEEEALDAVSEYIAAWEFEAGLKHGPDRFRLRFDYADIEDRDPSTGKVSLRPRPIRFHISVGDDVQVTLGKVRYPSPPTTALMLTPDVRSMHERYLGYRERREPLASMAYFCLTVLELPWGRRRRKRAASHYGIDETVLGKLGELTSTKGGVGARKAQGVPSEYTSEETRFLDEAVKAIIRRAAEVAHDPNAHRPFITMSDLPPI